MRTKEQKVDDTVRVPQILEQIGEWFKLMPQERSHERMLEQAIEISVSQIWDELAVVDQIIFRKC